MSRWFYKQSGERFSKFRNENNLKGLSTEGLSIAETNLDAYKAVKAVMKPDQVEGFCRQYGITVTAEEIALNDSCFDQGDILRACQSIILIPAVEADPNAVPPVVAVPAVTLASVWLNVIIGDPTTDTFRAWYSESTINIDDPRVVFALSQMPLPNYSTGSKVTITDIKKKIAEDRRVI